MPDTNVPTPMPGAKPSAPDSPVKSVDKRNEKSGPDPSDADKKTPTPEQHEQARQTLRQWLGVGDEPITGTDAKTGKPKTATEAAQDAESAVDAASQGVNDANASAGNYAH